MSKIKHYHQVNDDISVVDFENLTQIINSFGKTLEKLTPKNFNPKYNDKVKIQLKTSYHYILINFAIQFY